MSTLFESISKFDSVPTESETVNLDGFHGRDVVAIQNVVSYCDCHQRVFANSDGRALAHVVTPESSLSCTRSGLPVSNIFIRCKICSERYFQRFSDRQASRHFCLEGLCSAEDRAELSIIRCKTHYVVTWKLS